MFSFVSVAGLFCAAFLFVLSISNWAFDFKAFLFTIVHTFLTIAILHEFVATPAKTSEYLVTWTTYTNSSDTASIFYILSHVAFERSCLMRLTEYMCRLALFIA